MHTNDLSPWQHSHTFDTGNAAGEHGTRLVMWITAATMLVEIVAGLAFNSMALLADGLHMSSHAVAIGVSAFAYAAARRWSGDTRFSFGPWKVEVLAGFASAVFLLAVVILMVAGSVERLWSPTPIRHEQALLVATLGLAVNLVCAVILGRAQHGHGHDHGHPHVRGHGSDHGHGASTDLNLCSAYVHVIADAATSVLAIAALLGGWLLGWDWLDPAVGLLGAVLVASWARTLISDTGRVLLDREMDHPVVEEIRQAVQVHGAAGHSRLADLHVWRVGRQSFACALTVVTHDDALSGEQVRTWLAEHEELVHSTVEVQRCRAG